MVRFRLPIEPMHNFVDVMEVEHDIENITLDEYLQYESKRERHDYESSCEDDEEDIDSIEKVIDDLFRMGAENLKRMEKRKLKWKIVMRGNWNNFRILRLAVTHTYRTYFTQTRAGVSGTEPMLDELLEEFNFRDELLYITVVDEVE
ncbi:hypothetical protein Tco_1232031 [Tanacetum coccineum]